MGREKKRLKALRRRRRGGRLGELRSSALPSRLGRDLTLLSYTISFDALDLPEVIDPIMERALPAGDREALHALLHDAPAAAIPQLEVLVERFPGSRMLMNWLASAYSHVGDDEKAEHIIRLNFELHPDYLFARLAYAQRCLRRGDLDRVREVFEDKFDLKLMYPHRDVFHVSEFVAFCSVAVEYFMRTGETEAAHALFGALDDMCPDHPVTNQLRRVLEGSLLLRFAKMVQRRMGGAALRSRR